MPIPEWTLLRNSRPVGQNFLQMRNQLRSQIPGEANYHSRDFFKQIPDHIIGMVKS